MAAIQQYPELTVAYCVAVCDRIFIPLYVKIRMLITYVGEKKWNSRAFHKLPCLQSVFQSLPFRLLSDFLLPWSTRL